MQSAREEIMANGKRLFAQAEGSNQALKQALKQALALKQRFRK
ncbi:hypothetical protein Y017_02235 [Alcanivorax sp. 97CO-5]|nr:MULTISPECIES: hypothetical protein [unclassified Alcanivorax]EUC71713.1 hypothetical protein Y017_02235 [Alcanivorax sp. 97CO-5]